MFFLQSFIHLSLNKYICAAAILLLCICISASAQDRDDEVVRVESSLVQLNVGVADRQGRAITNLSRNDFAVYEDGVRQNILNFEPTEAPFSLVLLLDMSGSTLNFRSTMKQAALRFIDALAPDDRVAVVSFSARRKKDKTEDKIETLTDFTSDRRKIAYAIERTAGSGETNFYKALKFALAELSKEGKRRKAIVVLTDGIDTEVRKEDTATTANAGSNEEAIAAVKPDASSSLNAVLNMADRMGVTIYPLALPSGNPKNLLPLTPQQAAIYVAARARLQTLANRTGGRLHEINRLEDMGRLYAEVAAELRTLYSIAYQPSTARPRDGNWHTISIEVLRPEMIARTRPGYYAR